MVDHDDLIRDILEDSDMDADLQAALELSRKEYSGHSDADCVTPRSGFFESLIRDLRNEPVTKRRNDFVSMGYILQEMRRLNYAVDRTLDSTPEVISEVDPYKSKTRNSLSRNILTDLMELLFGSQETRKVSLENIRSWCRQGFSFQTDPHLFWGLKQNYMGPCGVLASVQAYMLQCILFHNYIYGSLAMLQSRESDQTVIMQLREVYINYIRLQHPDFPEDQLHVVFLVDALCAVLYNCTPKSSYNLILFEPLRNQNMANPIHSITYESNYEYAEFETISQVATHMLKNINLLMGEMGVISFMLSVLATRGIDSIHGDMDDPSMPLIGLYGHCSQELVNLILQGKAVSNIFDGEKSLPGGDEHSSYKLRGITAQGTVGFLTEREASRHCQVGSYYKHPKFPVWVSGSFSHYTVIFGVNKSCCIRTENEVRTEAALNIWSCLDTDDNKFIPIDALPRLLEMLGMSEYYNEAKMNLQTDTHLILQSGFMQWYLGLTVGRGDTATMRDVTLFHYNGQNPQTPLKQLSISKADDLELESLRTEKGVTDYYGVDSSIVGFAEDSGIDMAKTIWTRWPKTKVAKRWKANRGDSDPGAMRAANIADSIKKVPQPANSSTTIPGGGSYLG
ncbi:FAM188A, putative [Babesia ovis]|uniref:FAM188A, putative n=1 Tax=Babesia ovis TaxID=5869 RepID=A0A9W5T9S1_BABOV|nr:FAM188A, putative [Babesia ovis]